MSATLLEMTRAYHEEIEHLERTIVKDLQNNHTSNRDSFFSSHRIHNMIDQISKTTSKLIEIYDDKDKARKDEIAALRCQTGNYNVLTPYDDRLREIREYHKLYPAACVVDESNVYEQRLKEEPYVKFSGEEGFGRYLDLHELYNDFINSKFGESVEYFTYLQVFSQVHKIPRKLKMNKQYKEYLSKLVEYLICFVKRTKPLQDLEKIFSYVEAGVDEQWASGHDPSQHTVIDLDYYSTVEEVIEVGPEQLKEALTALGLKTGGTIRQRAERLFLTKDTPVENLDRKHFGKGSRGSEQEGVASTSQEINDWKEIALMEAKLGKLCDLLQETIVCSKENVEKKQALTYEEMEVEKEEEEVQDDTESDGDEQQIDNPKKLPMGWDGKPIPYWLYRLHGLNQKYNCEICGDYSYFGRRAYERHFREQRHQHGMHRLGIPNNNNFNEITSIEEARELWGRIQERQGENNWRPDLEEEYEDQEGNIYNKKTYNDLQRQGLI